MTRLVLAAFLLIGAAAPPEQQAEEAARRFALSAVKGPRDAFLAALDADALLKRKIGERAWRGLTRRQQTLLRNAVSERFAAMIAPPPTSPAGVAWAQALAARQALSEVVVGISIGEKTLKTRWRMKPQAGRWRVEDIVLADPGISLSAAAIATLGPEPVRPKAGFPAAGSALLPWLGLLAAIGLAVLAAAPRVPPGRRRLLFGIAIIPAVVLLAGATAAVLRLVSEPYSVRIPENAEPWRQLQQRAVAAQREGEPGKAHELADRAAALGAPRGAMAYEMGLAARERGDPDEARRDFHEALEAPVPAPGAARELAAMALERGELPVAEQRIGFYLATAGPDPDALSLQAVIEANLGKESDAVQAMASVRRLLGPGPKAAELEAKIRARASDAAGAVAALRPLVDSKVLDREALRSDPAYLPIATAPDWVKFLNEPAAENRPSKGNAR